MPAVILLSKQVLALRHGRRYGIPASRSPLHVHFTHSSPMQPKQLTYFFIAEMCGHTQNTQEGKGKVAFDFVSLFSWN